MLVPHEEPKKPRKPKKPSKPKEPTNKPRVRSLPVPVPASSAPLSVVNPDAAGVDVHSDMHMVCVPADRDVDPVRQFGANTADLQEIAVWLKKCGVKTVALESTGIYWIPLFELLESQGFEVMLVEPGQLSRCGARPKTDVLDAQWIQRLHSYGLLRGSFRPPDSVLALRLLPATADAGALRRCSCPTHAEGLGADERQTDGSHERHHGTDGHFDHRRHSARPTQSQEAGQTAAWAL